MKRLENKCMIASAAFHGLLMAVLLFGAALMPKQDVAPLQRFTLLNLTATDSVTSNDGPTAPLANTPVSKPETAEPPKKPALSKQELTMVSRNNPTPAKNPSDDRRIRNAVNDAVKKITGSANTSGAVSISPDVGAGPLMANYGDIVYSHYRSAWTPPPELDDESISVTASVTIARDGQVLRHEIKKRSGNVAMDSSIDATMENVTFIDAFPAESKDSQRTYTIRFSPGKDR